MGSRRITKWVGSITLLLALVLLGHSAVAVPITATDYDSITVGNVVDDPDPKTLIPDVGTLDMVVFFNSGIYTYEIAMNPSQDDAIEVITPTDLYGFTGTAGWSFSDALSAGGPGDETAWEIDFSNNDRLTWLNPAQDGGSSFFDTGESIRFFFQSTYEPAALNGNYVLAAGGTSGWQSGPIPSEPPLGPEPGTLGLLALGAIALFRFSRSRKRR